MSAPLKLRNVKLMEKFSEIARPNATVRRMLLKVDENGEVWIEDVEIEVLPAQQAAVTQ